MKVAVAQMLGAFVKPADVVRVLREEYEVEATVRQVMVYDAAKPYFEAGDKYREIFEAVRRQTLEEVSGVPIASPAYRLTMLQRTFEAAMKAKNLGLANATLEQAAKEAGGLFSNVRHFNVDRRDLSEMSVDERRARFAALCNEALKKPNAPGTEAVQ